MDKKIYAIVGMAGSGKSEVIDFLQRKYGWPKVYFGDITFEEMKRLGLEINYDNEKIAREGLRKEFGMGSYAIKSLPMIKEELRSSDVVLIESLYSWDEYKVIKGEFGDSFKTIAVYASPDIRLGRMKERKDWRPVKDEEELRRRDWTEIEGTDKGGPIAIADYTIINEGTMGEYHEGIRQVMAKEGFKIL